MKSAHSKDRNTANPSVALVYDRVNSVGGAERVLQQLHALYPAAPLYTSVYEPQSAPWADGWDVRTSWLQRLSWARSHHRWFGWLMPLVFWTLPLGAYDTVITVTSEFAKCVRTNEHQRHICYLLTPTRYLWSHHASTLRLLPVLVRPLAWGVFWCLRRIDRWAAQQPDSIVPISKLVAQRCLVQYGRQTHSPIYPPIALSPRAQKPAVVPAEAFVFVHGRHVAYKRFDWVVRAAVQNQQLVVIAGSGPETKRLQQLAGQLDPQQRWVHWVGRVSDSELRWYLEHAQSAWFPQLEDFGIAIMEAALAGCPVVAHRDSGASELLTAQDGVFFSPDTYQGFLEATQKIGQQTWVRLDITRRAQHYAGVYFAKQWQNMMSTSMPRSAMGAEQKR